MAIDEAIESMWETYNNINDIIRFSDTKAGLILASNGVVLSFIFTKLVDIRADISNDSLFVSFLLIGFVLGLLSIIGSILSIKPTLKNNDDRSLIYFGNISGKYKSNLAYRQAVFETFQVETELLGQIADVTWTISGIAIKKYKILNLSIWLLLLETISFGIAGLISIIF